MTETFARVRVFDGETLLDGLWDVETDASVIRSVHRSDTSLPDRDGMVDGTGCTLLPGLIDAHVHLRGAQDLRTLARWGITTAFDMGSWAPILEELRQVGPIDVRGTGAGAVGPSNPLARQPGRPADSIAADPASGRRFVAARVAEGVDFVKVIVDPPGRGGLEPETVAAIVDAAHEAGKLVVAHASHTGAIRAAQRARADVLTHAPLDAELDATGASDVLRSGRTVVPTLVMMEGVAANAPVPGLDYRHARDTVAALHALGVPLVLGTDANQAPGAPANVSYGDSVHRELELLIEVGLTPSEALHAATGASADRFGLPDRGRIAVGMRADLLLVAGDPTAEIIATRSIQEVRSGGRDPR